MARHFQMSELRTLVARALQVSDYAPAVSARVRAVPDTRTIRYYTTLGLLSPPAEMRGRVAYYDETHVLQIVAIKQLQGQNLSLSDIQQKLVGLTHRKLESLAKLPEDFWNVADRYLASRSERQAELAERQAGAEASDANASDANASDECESEFWLTPAGLPNGLPQDLNHVQDKLEQAETITIVRLTMSNGLKVSIELPREISSKQPLDKQALQSAIQPIVEELRRQNLVD